jgi:NTP pyrophosphatase (non-canonical NTP hydrolase)
LIKRREINSRTSGEKEAFYNHIVAKAKKTLNHRFLGLDELVEMFDEIYSPNYYSMSIDEIAFHFTEEIGEVAEQIKEIRGWERQARRQNAKKNEILEHLRRELADVSSWTAGLVNKINNELARNARGIWNYS